VSRRALWLLVVLVLVAAAGGGYLGVIAPRRAQTARTSSEIQSARDQLQVNRALAARAARTQNVQAANLFELERAMPAGVDVQDVLLQLGQLAEDSRVQVLSIQPQDAVPATGYSRVPIGLSLNGTYAGLQKFLAEVRELVLARGDRIVAAGRLFTVDSVSLSTKTPGLPDLQADVTIGAYIFGDAKNEAALTTAGIQPSADRAGVAVPAPGAGA
jgi:Tfp pilus assembly protein PilO